jgi:hypothetical protein
MSLEALDNLVRIEKLHREPPDQQQFDNMVQAAKTQITDLEAVGLSDNGQFTLAYGAAH